MQWDYHAIQISPHNYHSGYDGQRHGLLAPLPLFEVLPHLVNLPLHGTQIILLFPQFSFQLIFAFHLLLQKSWNITKHCDAASLDKSWDEHRLWVFENRVLRSMCGSKGKNAKPAGENYIISSFAICSPHQLLTNQLTKPTNYLFTVSTSNNFFFLWLDSPLGA
jgi:hypothetical protein